MRILKARWALKTHKTLWNRNKNVNSHNIMLWVSFSDSRDGIDLNGWISSFQTPQKKRKLLLLLLWVDP